MESRKSKIDLFIIGIILVVLVFGVGLILRPRDFMIQVKNTTRHGHMQLLMTAIYTYVIDHNGIYPECLPEQNQPAISMNGCYNELRPYLMHLVVLEPDYPKHTYMIEYVPGEKEKILRIFSTSPEAKDLEVIR